MSRIAEDAGTTGDDDKLLYFNPAMGESRGPKLLRLALRALLEANDKHRDTGLRRYKYLRSIFKRIIGCGGTIVLELNHDSRFAFPLLDPYWSNIFIFERIDYEVELAHILKRAKELDYAFIDCGANFGYWSALSSSDENGRKKTIAVEASPETFTGLEITRHENNKRFVALNRAVYLRSGDTVNIECYAHTGRRIAGTGLRIYPPPKAKDEYVKTITLDDVIDMVSDSVPYLLVKLDIEGVESQVIEASNTVHQRDCLIFCEDHVQDQENSATRSLRSVGYEVHYFDPIKGRFLPINDREVSNAKKMTIGNFIGLKPDSAWHSILQQDI